MEYAHDLPISDDTRTEISLPSTSFRFSLTTNSRWQRRHRTVSLPWQTHPRFAHSTSFTLSGFGVQSVISWKVLSRFKRSPRSVGAYRAGGAFEVLDDSWPCVRRETIADIVADRLALFPSLGAVESGKPSRLRFWSSSRSALDARAGESEAVEPAALCASVSSPFLVVEDPRPCSRVLNFLFVALVDIFRKYQKCLSWWNLTAIL